LSKKKLASVLSLCAFVGCLLAKPARAANNSTVVPITLNATVGESITVTLTTGSTVNFSLTGSSADAGLTIPAWTTRWNLNPTRTTVTVCAFLSGPLNGTGGNTDTIPVANILGSPAATGTYTAFTGTGCGQPNELTINTYSTASTGSKNVTESESVALEINDSTLTLQADTYTGTLNIVAQATP
jgi:hypothetical protein